METAKSTDKKAEKKNTPNTKITPEEGSSTGDSEKEDIVCCCLCYASVDYSDKSYFCQEARDADSDLEGDQPLLLPVELYDPNNALVYCDSCDRPYHQRCHFVPVIHLPRGKWHCLICSTQDKLVREDKKKWTKSVLSKKLYQMDKPAGTLELEWEFAAKSHKLTFFKSEMRRLKGQLSLQLQSIRLAQMALKALTTTRRKTDVATLLKSQELCQTLVKLSTAKLRVRQLLQSLEAYRQSSDKGWNMLLHFLDQHGSERKIWFPYIDHNHRRREPRLHQPSIEEEWKEIPTEIDVDKNNNSDNNCTKQALKSTSKSNNGKKISAHETKGDDDSGISLDDLRCCVCFQGEATDENDLILCDTEGCFRAHHLQCLQPALNQEEAEQEENWFCPLCTTLAKLVAEVQSEFTGDEWVTEDQESVKSWDHVDDVFPESEKENAMALKWKAGNLDAEAKDFYKQMFGDDDDHEYENDAVMEQENDDDDEEDDDFDPTAKNDVENDDDSDASSKASHLDMALVDADIGAKELEALSGGESSEDDEEEKNHGTRRSRRRRSARSSRASTDNESSSDEMGKFTENNIVLGKRRRRKIDYRLLNDSMFGKLSTKDKNAIDDQDEFQYEPKGDSSDGSDNDDDNVSACDDSSHDNVQEIEGGPSKEESESEEEGKKISRKTSRSVCTPTSKVVSTRTKRVVVAKKEQRRIAAKRCKT